MGRFLRAFTQRQDLALVALLMMIIFMIILPLPTWLIDALIALNLSIVVLILIVTVYLDNPTKFSTLPAILLFSTLFRLAISISTTRLILVQADAGRIVETFGAFVVGGNMIVGIVVFLIITVVQFVVITKGSERVAEVSARFSLDALPGRQMAIDADMRAGEIDMSEAKRRRSELQLESEFYGSMDGAMKFVKGDAIAGIIIIFVNILGGIAIGVLQKDMSMGEATNIYSVLTVGDGLVSQIPALFMAISSGIVITRITSDTSTDLGSDIAEQISGNPRALQISAVVLVILGLVPGFPMAIFFALAFAIGGLGLWSEIAYKRQAQEELESGGQDGPDISMTPMSAVHMALGDDLAAEIDKDIFQREALLERARLFEQLGVPFPPVHLRQSNTPGRSWTLLIEGVPVADGSLPESSLRIVDDPENARILGLQTESADLVPSLPESHWVAKDAEDALQSHGVAYQSPERVLAVVAGILLPRHARDFLGVHETNLILSSLENRYDELVKEAQKALPLQKIAQIFRRLVEEDVSVRNTRIVLETIVEWAGREKDPDVLAEYARVALGRQICHRYADSDRYIAAYIIEQDIEDTVRDAITVSSGGSSLSLSAEQSRSLLSKIRDAIGSLAEHRSPPVILTAMDVRRFLRSFLDEHGVDCPIMSFKEVAPQYQVQPLAVLSMR